MLTYFRFILQKHHLRLDALLGQSSSSALSISAQVSQYSWFNDFSGQIAFEGWSMSYYNVIFTILPPLVIGIFDQFVSARMLDRYPQLYQLGQQNYFFSPHTFFYWVGNAFYHSVVSAASVPSEDLYRHRQVLFFFSFAVYYGDLIASDGKASGLWVWGTTLYMGILLTVLGKAALISECVFLRSR